jgi:HK97 family phage prohead protease
MTVSDIDALVIGEKGELFHHLEGRAVPFDQWADLGLFMERHHRDSFTASLAKQWRLPLLAFHRNTEMPIGVAEAWEARSDGLWGRWRLARSAVAQEAASWAREGGLGLSVGFSPTRSEWEYAKKFDPARGSDGLDRVTRLESRLLEVSLTPTPAFVDSIVSSVEAASLDGSDRSLVAEYRHWLHQGRTHRVGPPLRSARQTEPPAPAAPAPAPAAPADVPADETPTPTVDLADLLSRVERLERLAGTSWGLPDTITELDDVSTDTIEAL